MFCHIVMLSLQKPLSKADCEEIEEYCIQIRKQLPDVVSMRFVYNISDRARGYTHAFVAEFIDECAHDRYQKAEVHIQLKEKIQQLKKNMLVLDYEI